MEAKLAEFRRQKHAEFTSNKAKNNPLSPKYIPTAKNRENAFVAFIHRVFRLLATFTIVQKFLAKIEGVPVISNVYFLYFVLWITGYLLFLEHGFGIVYLTSSIIGVIFCNLGTREEGTLSAYSVFNPNFERLQGTFSSDDFERNVLHRPKVD